MKEDHDGLLRKPIIVVGSPRSGTTFLSQLLRSHRAVAYVVEPRLVWRYGNDGKSDLLRPEDARPEVCEHIRNAFAQEVRQQGKQRLAEKTPSNSLRMGFVERVFPDCRFVHIIRNGVDAALSIRNFWVEHTSGVGGGTIRAGLVRQRLKEVSLRRLPYYAKEVVRRVMPRSLARFSGPKLWGPRIPGLESMAREMDLLEIGCLQWRMCVELACEYGRGLPRERYLEMRLEDLSRESVRAMLEFCELDDDPQVLTYLEQKFDPGKPKGRQSDVKPEELRTILKWIEPTMRWLDYPVPGNGRV